MELGFEPPVGVGADPLQLVGPRAESEAVAGVVCLSAAHMRENPLSLRLINVLWANPLTGGTSRIGPPVRSESWPPGWKPLLFLTDWTRIRKTRSTVVGALNLMVPAPIR